MKCPLLRQALIISIGKDVEALDDCLEEECAWWYGELGCCSMFMIAKKLNTLNAVIKNIEAKIPSG